MDCYEVEIEGSKTKATVIESPDLLDTYVSELRDYITQRRNNGAGVIDVVGLDIHTNTYNRPLRLVLYFPSHILIIQWNNLIWVPDSLIKFFQDESESICLVGSNIERKISMITSRYFRSKPTEIGVEIRFLAARVLKKNNLERSSLGELGRLVGINPSALFGGGYEYSSLPNHYIGAFSEEGIKCAVHKAYICYAIGRKLALGKFVPH